jgi:hypothetical protein
MPSSLCIHLGHIGHIGHIGHLSHLGYLSTIGNLNTLNPYPLATTLMDSYHRAFITEMDPNNPGLSEGYFTDNLLNPLPTTTPLLPDYYTSQFPSHTSQSIHDDSLDLPLNTIKGHGSLLEIHQQIYDSFALDSYDSLALDY